MTHYFIFGQRYRTGDDYVRCDRRRSTIVAPGVGETDADEELSLRRCLAFARRGTLHEVTAAKVGERRSMIDAFGAVAELLRAVRSAAPAVYQRRFNNGWQGRGN
jgi:hypothetical protein